MDVLVTGASGFIGSELLPALVAAGHRPIRALRGHETPRGVDAISWDPDAGTMDVGALEGIGGVVHLAGAGIGDKRWTPARKRVVVESRTRTTRLLAETLANVERKPTVFVSGSAVGYYGHDRGDEACTEASPPGDDFLTDVCEQWEAATDPAEAAGIRVVHARTGIVLGRRGGVLKRLLLPFRLGFGGRLGSGQQWMSWISLDDEIAAILHALTTQSLSGGVNLTAPNPVTNAEFTKTLGRVLHRPTVVPTPLFPLKALYGRELVDTILAGGQRVLPAALEASGYAFRHSSLEGALQAVLEVG